MQIQYNYADIPSSTALETHAESQLTSAIGHLADRLTRIEVYFQDANGDQKRGPADKRCTLEARPRGLDPIDVHADTDSYITAVNEAAGKLKRALMHKFERLEG